MRRRCMSYTHEGLVVVRGLSTPRRELHAWDSVRVVRLKGGAVVTRYVLTVRREHTPFITRGLGLLRRGDVGRVLVVDRLPDHRWVDYLL